MSGERDEDKAWAELVDAFHTDPDPLDDAPRWPAAENIDPDDEPPGPDPAAHDTRGGEPGGLAERPADEQPGRQADHPADDLPDPFFGASRTLGDLPTGTPAGSGPHPFAPRADSGGDAYTSDDDHFVPPNPPPMPRGDRVTRWAWAGMIAAPSVLLLASIMGWSLSDEFMALLVGGFVAGFVTLIARMRGRNPHDPDDGAVV